MAAIGVARVSDSGISFLCSIQFIILHYILFYSKRCLPGQHPRLRWNRKKRSIDHKFARAKFLLNHYRSIKRKHFDHHAVEDFVKTATIRDKRSNKTYRGSRKKRQSRNYSEIDRAYSKYYEKIKARYRNYVKNLFPKPKARNSQMNNTYSSPPVDVVKNTKKIQVQDGRWYNSYNNPEFKYKATHKARTFSNDLQSDDIETEMGPVVLPSINDPIKSNKYEFFNSHNETISNYYPSSAHHHNDKHFPMEDTYESLRKINSSADMAAHIYAQLQSQINRKKREADDESKGNYKSSN